MAENPFLWPNFHSVCDKSLSLNITNNRFAYTSQLDFNGFGFLNENICAKRNSIANFYARSPTLPYFLNKCRLQNDFAAKNCLLLCKNEDKNLLITTKKTSIFGLLIEDNKLTDSVSSDDIQTKSHAYSADESVSYGPFRYCTQKLCDLYINEEEDEGIDIRPINELKVHRDDQNLPQIQSNSRNKIRFFKFKSGEELDLFSELNIENFRRSDDSLFESCDRNHLIDNQLLVSYNSNDFIDLYDFETNQTIRSFDFETPNDEIGLYWSESHPKMFFNGYNKHLLYCDSRSRKTVLEFFAQKNDNSFDWEMFYQILPTKLNPNQVFVATDYHILVADWRYPKNSLLQLYHMIPDSVIRSLKSLEVMVDNRNTELLVSSNLHRNCLMSFTSLPNLVPLSSTHLPIHLSNPKDIDKKFENHFYRGIELIEGPDSSGFSLALLTNFGDIFIQDLFWCTSDEDMCDSENDPKYRDRTFCSGVGSTALKLDLKTEEYMSSVNDFLYRAESETKRDDNYIMECLLCSLNRVCSSVNGECMCKTYTPPAPDNRQQTDRDSEEVVTDRSAFIETLYRKHLGGEIWANRQRLENKEELSKTTDRYTKTIFKVWNVFEEEPIDPNTSSEKLDTISTDMTFN